MSVRSLFIFMLALVILAGTSSAGSFRRREYRPKQARISPVRTFSPKVLRERPIAKAPRITPRNPYSSRGYLMRPYRDKKPMRGGGRGTIKVLR